MVRCRGITLSGKRCKKSCKSRFCWIHQEICSICLDDIKFIPIKLDCGHKFCGSCINEWIILSKNCNCPTCRMVINIEFYRQAYIWGITNNVLIKINTFEFNLSSVPNSS